MTKNSIKLIVVFVALFLMQTVNSFAQELEEDSKVLFTKESPYNHIIVTQQKKLRIMHFKRLSSIYNETVLDLDNHYNLILEYSKLMIAGFGFMTEPRKILMIGLGGGVITRYISHYYKQTQIDNVEIDEVVANAAKRYFGWKTSDKIKLFIDDGRMYLRKNKNQYDIIFLDAYRGGFIPFHLKTEQFLKIVSSHLNPEGIVVSNLHMGTALFDSDLATYYKVFKHNYLFEGQIDLNGILVSHNFDPALTKQKIIKNFQDVKKIHKLNFDIEGLIDYYNPNVKISKKAIILTDDHAPVEYLKMIQGEE